MKFIPRSRPSNAAPLLWAIREGRFKCWRDICTSYGLSVENPNTAHYMVWDKLYALIEAELVVYGDGNEVLSRFDLPEPDESLTLSRNWQRVQQALGISLELLAHFDPDRYIVCTPLFGVPFASQKPVPHVFVAMPFTQDLESMYRHGIREACEKVGLTVARGDDFFSTNSIVSDIWNSINSAKLVVADCTGRNANVFYEIGISHTLGKPVVLISQTPSDVPFDVRHLRYIEYVNNSVGLSELGAKLQQILPSLVQ